jgi:hypothetical protein
MILPVIYAVLTWYCAGRWRRRWGGFAAVAASVGVLLAMAALGSAWADRLPWTYRAGLVLFWPYVLLVGGIGAYIAVLPRRAGPGQCKGCHYDLGGLSPEDLVCPECGRAYDGPGSGRETKVDLLPVPRLTPEQRREAMMRRRAI